MSLAGTTNRVKMNFSLDKSIEILKNTPSVVSALLSGLSDDWLVSNEGNNLWSRYDVIGHLVVGERTDWITRTSIILNQLGDTSFQPFDRFAQMGNDHQRTIIELLDEFATLRTKNLADLNAMEISKEQLDLTGIHPDFGTVTLE